jgi:uncharacterized protein DUF4190
MSQPSSGGAPDPFQPQQPYGQGPDPTTPYGQDPYAGPAGGQPGGYPPPRPYPTSGQPGGYAAPPPYPTSGQPGEYPPPYSAGGQQAYYGQPAYPGYGPQTRTNALAIASLACSLGGLLTCISAPVGIVLGHIAKRQIRQTGEQGEGMATAGLWVGYIVTVLFVLFLIGWLALVVFAIFHADNTTY